MTTSYYRYRWPVTSVRIEVGTTHDQVRIWVRHGSAGILTVPAEDGALVALMFASDERVMETLYGGDHVGVVVTEHEEDLADELHIIDEYGKPTTVEAVRASASTRGRP